MNSIDLDENFEEWFDGDNLKSRNLRDPKMHASAWFATAEHTEESAHALAGIVNSLELLQSDSAERYAGLSSWLAHGPLSLLTSIEATLKHIKWLLYVIALIEVVRFFNH